MIAKETKRYWERGFCSVESSIVITSFVIWWNFYLCFAEVRRKDWLWTGFCICIRAGKLFECIWLCDLLFSKWFFSFFFLFRFGFSLQNTKRLTNWYVLNNWNICFGNDKTKLHKMTNEERIRKCHNLYILSDRFPAQLTLICWRIIEKKLIKREKKPNPENKQNTIWAAHKCVIVNMKCEKKNVTIGFLGWIPTKKKQFQLSKCEKSIYFIDYLNIHSLFRTVDSIH